MKCWRRRGNGKLIRKKEQRCNRASEKRNAAENAVMRIHPLGPSPPPRRAR